MIVGALKGLEAAVAVMMWMTKTDSLIIGRRGEDSFAHGVVPSMTRVEEIQNVQASAVL